jgi:hypothetical protein
VTVGIAEVHAAAAVVVIDHTRSAQHRISPVVELACDDALEDLVELGFADEERVVLCGDVTVDLVIVE